MPRKKVLTRAGKENVISVTPVEKNPLSAGHAGVDSRFAWPVWKKTCGDCPAMRLPGYVRIAETCVYFERDVCAALTSRCIRIIRK